MGLLTLDPILYDIHLARLLLVRARIARQLGTIEQETCMYSDDNSTPEERAQALLDEAQG